MHRFQIYLDGQIVEYLTEESKRLKKSKSQLIREKIRYAQEHGNENGI